MSDGFLGFKALGWGAAALFGVAAIMPSTSRSQWNAMFRHKSSEVQRPSLLKKKSTTTTAGSTSTSTSTSSTTSTTTVATTTASYPELSIIPSNFDINSELIDAGAAAAPAVGGEAAFRFICGPGHILADDPIVFPGQPGKSHLHQFYGNTQANAYSTYESLRTTGQSTCMSPLNRSAYWMPAMLDGRGNVVRPDYLNIYYKRRAASDPTVADPANPQYEGRPIPLPNGLRFTFGWDPTGVNSARTGMAYFTCEAQSASHYSSITEAAAVCPVGSHLGAVISAPECWDGKNLDSADHRSHVSYPSYGSWGYQKCDAEHPYVIPAFTLKAWYSIVAGDDPSKWTLSSDAMAPGKPAGYTFHADWFGAWDPIVMAMWTDNCINKTLSCNGGQLGNGKQMKMYHGFSWTANPRLVPIPQ